MIDYAARHGRFVTFQDSKFTGISLTKQYYNEKYDFEIYDRNNLILGTY